MGNLAKNDYIEHWQYGIGKIIITSSKSVVVDFVERKNMEFPIEKTTYLKKLNTKGLLARLYDDPARVQDLIKTGSTEIIKLLIFDYDIAQETKIDRNKIKPLLTNSDARDQGWKSDYSLIQDKDWSKWWANINKKLKNDPWFDTSSKSEIILREKPVSKKEENFQLFLKEKDESKKLSDAEKLLKICKAGEDESIILDVANYIAGQIAEIPSNEVPGLALFLCVQLQKKGGRVEPFDDRAYELTLKALAESKLPVQKELSLYSFFSNLPNQDLIDHFYLYLHGSQKLKERIHKFLTKTKSKKLNLKQAENGGRLTQGQISAINSLTSKEKEVLYKEISEIVILLKDKTSEDIIASLLLSDSVDFYIKEAVSKVVVAKNMTSLVYRYFNHVDLVEESKIPFLQDFLSILGDENTELAFQHILLNEKTAKVRPQVFFAAYKELIECTSLNFSNDKIQSLINHADNILSKDGIDVHKYLRLKIGSISVDLRKHEDLKQPLGNTYLIDLAKSRQNEIERRIDAINILIGRRLKEECQSAALELTEGLTVSDIEIIDKIICAFPDTKFKRNLFHFFIEKASFHNKNDERAFRTLLSKTGTLDDFVDYILSSKFSDLFDKHIKKLQIILNDEQIAKKIARCFLKQSVDAHGVDSTALSKLSLMYSPAVKWVVGAAVEFSIEKESEFTDKLGREKDEHKGDTERWIKQQDDQILDAIDKRSQRYETHLAKLIPLLNMLVEIGDSLSTISAEEADDNSNSQAKNRILYVKEELEGVLKILKIIDRD
ncbi:MAG: hypothetical protein U9R02_14055 [Thermodesulfobacteriota bacterium]|nr:hypothetical protein [Thermodesulfobacteriota bacterium]